MDINTLLLLGTLELALVAGVLAILAEVRRRRQLARLHVRQTTTGQPPESFESVHSGYLPYLEQQLLQTRARREACTDETEAAALDTRIGLLEREKALTEHGNDFPEEHWQQLLRLYAPEPAGEPPPTEETQASVPDETGPAKDGDTKGLAAARERIARLESFRDHFFAIKKQLAELEKEHAHTLTRLGQLLPEAERSHALQQLLDDMSDRQERLQAELAQLESQADELTREQKPQPESLAEPADDSGERATELSQKLEAQQHEMAQLKRTIDRLENELAEAGKLGEELERMQTANRDMEMCLKTMEEENEFLQEQIRTLLALDDADSVYGRAGDNEEVARLQQALQEKDTALAALQEKFDAMEQEYLSLYEEMHSRSS
ncbi:MAG TPA: hypothetical protein ENJ79_05720 [Gammaproteobacteria bacterium]|nr:hypothetical protein [Gammaproteobacteria bacterium]